MGTYWSQNALTRCPKRLCLLLLLIAGIFPLASHAQNAGINIKLTDKPLSAFIQSIEQQTDFKFFYEQQQVDVKQHVTVNVRNASINAALEQALRNTNIAYSISEKRILLTQKQDNAPSQSGKVILAKGQVTDKNSIPVIGANILVKGSTLGCITDIDGNYSLEVPTGSTLVVSYIGYTTQEVTLKNNKFRQIVLEEDSKMLDDVVVVGYGTVKKRDLTGSVSSVKGDDLNLNGVSSIGHALEGKAAGLYIRQNSAQPGGGLDILVRGAGSVNASNDPLYIVDGFPIAKLDQASGGDAKMDPGTQGILNFLNPNDVESIEVLKDASATSIYGARAANGVVVITSKRGLAMDKAKITLRAQYGFSELAQTNWKMMNTDERIQFEKEVGLDTGKDYNLLSKVNVNWLDEVFNDRAPLQSYELSINRATDRLNYYVSGGFYDQDGIAQNSTFRRYNIRTNADVKAGKWLKVGTNTMAAYEEAQQADDGSYTTVTPISACRFMLPYWNPYAKEGSLASLSAGNWAGTSENPIVYMGLNPIKNKKYKVLSTMYAEIYPIENLTIRTQFGADFTHSTAFLQSFQRLVECIL